LIETFFHRLLAFSSIPVDLLIPPYSTPLSPTNIPLQPSRISRVALHPQLPIVALAQAHIGGSIFLFDLRTNAYLKYRLALCDSHQINALSFSKYNLLAAGTSTGDILVFELNLSLSASTASKPLRVTAIPSLSTLIPPQFPSFALLGEITDLNFDHRSGRYLAVATTRSGTWIYDTIYLSSLRLSKYPSSSVIFSPNENILAVAREKTGDIELYTIIRAGTLTFSLPTVIKSGHKSTVTRMQWASDGKSLLYCNDGHEGIRILHINSELLLPPGKKKMN
jgi:WD40 repeat protein